MTDRTQGSDLLDPDDPLTDRQVRDLVAEAAGLTAEDATPAPEGSDAVYIVEVAEPRGRVVLKASATDWSDLRTEAHLLRTVGEETPIPVPDLLGVVDDRTDLPGVDDDRTDLPSPAFVTAYVEGERLSVTAFDDAGDLRADVLDETVHLRVAREAGENLAHLHGLRSFDAAGPLVYDTETGLVVDPDERSESWREHFRTNLEDDFALLDDSRFADLVPALRETCEAHLVALEEPDRFVAAHLDYRFGNTLNDPETGELRALLDWGAVSAGTAESDLATAEALLTDPRPPDDRQRAIRRALYEGYERVRPLARDDDFRRRRWFYLLTNRIGAMRWLPHWYAGASAAEQEAVARAHREAATALCERA